MRFVHPIFDHPLTARSPRGLVIVICVIALTAGLLFMDPSAGSSGGPTAVVSKKKRCKKALWKCAPKRYNLFASGFVKFPHGVGSETFFADVQLVRRRATPLGAIYTTRLALVEVHASYVAEASRLLPDCRSDIKVDVPPQLILVGPSGLGGPTNFLLAFDLLGKNKNTYGLIAGATNNPELGGVEPAHTMLTCPADGRTVNSVGYLFRGSAILDTKRRGKLGDRVLIGHATKGGDKLYWVLTTRDDCGDICRFLPEFDIEPVVVPVIPGEPPFSDAPDPGVPDPEGPPTCGGVPC